MARYLLFTGVRYYPRGGAGDFQNAYDTAEEAIAAGQHFEQHGIDAEWNRTHEWYSSDDSWWHVFDLETRTIVAQMGNAVTLRLSLKEKA